MKVCGSFLEILKDQWTMSSPSFFLYLFLLSVKEDGVVMLELEPSPWTNNMVERKKMSKPGSPAIVELTWPP